MSCKFKILLFLSSVFFSLGSLGETLNFDIEVPKELSRNTGIVEVLNTAFRLVTHGKPRSDLNLKQNTTEGVDKLDFVIDLTRSDIVGNEVSSNHLLFEKQTFDAYTVLLGAHRREVLVVRILLDRVVDKMQSFSSVASHNDLLVRLTVILAHEIYGNVLNLKNPDFLKSQKNPKLLQAELEVAAFKAGVEFVQRILPTITSLGNQKLYDDFKMALVEEEKGLSQWSQKSQQIKIELAKNASVIDMRSIRCQKIYK